MIGRVFSLNIHPSKLHDRGRQYVQTWRVSLERTCVGMPTKHILQSAAILPHFQICSYVSFLYLVIYILFLIISFEICWEPVEVLKVYRYLCVFRV